jgi:hypothetical protein
MLTRQYFATSDDLVERAVYRLRTPRNEVTLLVKRQGMIRALGFGNGSTLLMSCDQWDRLYRPVKG